MRYPSALLLCFAFLTAPARALIWPSIWIHDSYEQVSEDTLVHWTPITMSVSLTLINDVNTADNVAMFGPDGAQLPYSPWSQPSFWTSDLNFDQRSDIPAGDYSFRFSGGSLDGQILSYRVDTALFAHPLPKLMPHSFRALFNTPVSQPIRLMLQPFQLARGTSSGEILVSISGPRSSGWGAVMPSLHLDPHTPYVDIPANLFLPNVVYSLSIVYITRGDEPIPGDLGYATTYWCSLHVQFKTSDVR